MDAPFTGRRLHFVGVGGAGMSGLALVARALGAEVTGSDRAESSYFARLREAGIEPRIGHDEPPPEGAEIVVSTAIGADNPELAAALAAGAPVLHRGDLLGEVSALKRTIAVAGTHGKTTTASMAALALMDAGADPGFLIGGELRALGTNAGWGGGDWAVVEADESDRSFLKLAREVAVVTSVELDHHATYRSLGELEQAFESFAEPAELAVLGPEVELDSARRSLSYGIDSGDLRAERVELLPLGSRFSVEGVEIELAVPGRHNVLNALAALAACRAAGVEPAAAAPGLARFTGAGRRFEDHGAHRQRSPGVRRLRPPPDRGAGHAHRGAHAGAAPARGLLPAAPLLAHAAARARVRAGAGARGPGRGAGRLRRARARARTSRASAACSWPGQPRTQLRGARSGGFRARRTPSASCATSWARATCCSPSARATWTASPGGSPRERARRGRARPPARAPHDHSHRGPRRLVRAARLR